MEEQKNAPEGMEEKEDILPDAGPEEENESGGAKDDVAEAEDNDIEDMASEDADSEAEEEEDDDGVGTIPPIPKMARGFHISGRLMFQNEFTITKEIYLEFVKAFMSQYRKLYYIMGGLSIFLGLFSILGGAFSSGFIFVLVGIVCLVMPFFLYLSLIHISEPTRH